MHWFVPIELGKRGGSGSGGVDADKQVELAADALAEEMAARREQPLYGPSAGLASHPVAAVRLLLKRLVLTPAMGKRKVFIVGDAERLIPQLGTEVAGSFSRPPTPVRCFQQFCHVLCSFVWHESPTVT